jgi:hypothetical protein
MTSLQHWDSSRFYFSSSQFQPPPTGDRAMSTPVITPHKSPKEKLEAKLAIYNKMLTEYTSHKINCAKLRDEFHGEQELSDCTCGYEKALQDAHEGLKKLS